MANLRKHSKQPILSENYTKYCQQSVCWKSDDTKPYAYKLPSDELLHYCLPKSYFQSDNSCTLVFWYGSLKLSSMNLSGLDQAKPVCEKRFHQNLNYSLHLLLPMVVLTA